MHLPSSASRPLDWLNFFVADVRDGLGPYLAIYLLAVHHWRPDSIGLVMTISGLAALAVLPLGAIVGQSADSLRAVSPAMLKRVDQEAETTLLRLYRQSPKAQALIGRSFGVLVVPVLHADGGILGVAYGRGVLIDAEGDRSYYNVVGAPPGSVLGLDGKALILFFSASESLRAFQAKPGWVEGEDGRIQILDDTSMAGQRSPTIEPIAGFILSANGLASGLSLRGSLFIKVPVYLCTGDATSCR